MELSVQPRRLHEHSRMVEKEKSDLSTKECNVVCSPSPNIQKRLLLTRCLAEGVYTGRAVLNGHIAAVLSLFTPLPPLFSPPLFMGRIM